MTHSHALIDREAHLAAAEKACAAAGESLTPLRKRVLALLVDSAAPAKAYDLLQQLGVDDRPAKPPTIYRALDFLMRLGLAHKIQSLNAFIACEIGGCERSTIFLICDRCGAAEEFDAGHALVDLSEAAARDGFAIKRTMIEASGLCAKCQSAA
ncbi:MAG: transcriptional repressor [Hyphomonadaceae bacterium]